MLTDPNEVVAVASGPLVQIELYEQALSDAGITCRSAGADLSAGFGTAVPTAVVLYVHRADEEAARAEIAALEADRGRTDVPDTSGEAT